jgi:hypothetical protein
MATNPYFTQLHTQRFSFIGSPQQRDGTTLFDQRFLNVYPELITSPITEGKKYYLKKRPGLSVLYDLPAGFGRGIFYWHDVGGTYSAINNQLYFNQTPILTLSNSSGTVGFCEYRHTDGQALLIVLDGLTGWIITVNNVVTEITDVGFPSPHIPAPVFLDGYIFVAKVGTSTIYNSSLDDPTGWPSDGFIDAEMYPDQLATLTKAQNYLVAVGNGSVEFFYDNANATGSPLQRNAPAVAQFGTPAPLSVQQTEKEVVMIGQTFAGGRTVWSITGFQPEEIANAPIREALDQEGTAINLATAFIIQVSGHKFYVMNLKLHQRTFVYDFDEKMWHEWSNGLGQNCFNTDYATDSSSGNPTILDLDNGAVYALAPQNWDDAGNPINCVIQTVKLDFDTMKRKRVFRLSIVGDSPAGDNPCPISVQFSDDDYNTWSTARILELNADYPTITRLGLSRRRAWKFTFVQPFPLRLESFEVDIIQEVRR